MPAYRTYIIGRADHFWGAEDIECADVELWERRRFIVRLSSDLIPK
jgi:hypothetical protein